MEFDWLNSVVATWPVLVGIPGLVAFYWQWRDRRAAQLASAPFAALQDVAERYMPRLVTDWKFMRLYVRNDLNVPVILTRLEVLSPRHVYISPAVGLRGGMGIDETRVGSDVPLDWSLSPTGSEGASTKRWVFLASKKRAMSKTSIIIRATLRERSASAREIKIKVTSPPISVPQINADEM